MAATFTEKNMEMIPFAADDMMILQAELYTLLEHRYFIVARCISGARFYSESFGWEDAIEYFKTYKYMTNYFGGGEVTLYEECYGDDCDVVRSEVCWGF